MATKTRPRKERPALSPKQRRGDPASGGRYHIVVRGHLEPRWADWFSGLDLRPLPGGDTCLQGELEDQPALHGLLARIRDLGLVLVSLNRLTESKEGIGALET